MLIKIKNLWVVCVVLMFLGCQKSGANQTPDDTKPVVQIEPLEEKPIIKPAMESLKFTFPTKVTGFADHSNLNRSFYLTDAGMGWSVETTVGSDGFRVGAETTYQVDPACKVSSQSTDFTHGGMSYAEPLFVGMGRVCIKDDKTMTISKLASFNSPPDSFSVAFFGRRGTDVYFLQNSKPTRNGIDDSIITLITVSLAEGTVTLRTLLTDQPGFSGAMTLDNAQNKMWLTSGVGNESNDIYDISSSAIEDLIVSGQTKKFLEVAKLRFSDVPGLSIYLLQNDKNLAYLNGIEGYPGYESYTVDKLTGARVVIDDKCLPVVGKAQFMLGLCNGVSLEVF